MGNRKFAPITILFMALALMAGTVAAQDATPAGDGMAHPAHIHFSTCDDLGDIVYPLNDVTHGDMMTTPDAGLTGTPDAALAATPSVVENDVVAQSTTTVMVPLEDLLAEEHAINVHQSEEDLDDYIACGNITGTPTNGMLQIELMELNDSGFVGQAVLMDNGDGTTDVTVMLMDADMMATPAA